MIAFHSPDISDRSWIHPILFSCDYPGADYTFNDMLLWSCYYGEVGRVGDFVTQHSVCGSCHTYLYPAGQGDIAGALRQIIDDAHERGGTLRLRGLTQQTRAQLESLYPDRFTYTAYRDSYDYIYTVEELSQLHGKKLQAKRNHCNRFEAANPDWYTAPMTSASVPQCQAMLRAWYTLHEPGCTAQELDQLQKEKGALALAFEHFEALGLDGLLLYDGEALIAFSMGGRMNERYYDVIFEKAFPNVNGAYAMINREFSRMIAAHYPQVDFLNREDDMGAEGLRRAKESYQPTLLLEKFVAQWKETDPCV